MSRTQEDKAQRRAADALRAQRDAKLLADLCLLAEVARDTKDQPKRNAVLDKMIYAIKQVRRDTQSNPEGRIALLAALEASSLEQDGTFRLVGTKIELGGMFLLAANELLKRVIV